MGSSPSFLGPASNVIVIHAARDRSRAIYKNAMVPLPIALPMVPAATALTLALTSRTVLLWRFQFAPRATSVAASHRTRTRCARSTPKHQVRGWMGRSRPLPHRHRLTRPRRSPNAHHHSRWPPPLPPRPSLAPPSLWPPPECPPRQPACCGTGHRAVRV